MLYGTSPQASRQPLKHRSAGSHYSTNQQASSTEIEHHNHEEEEDANGPYVDDDGCT